jgi:hypothetical protein
LSALILSAWAPVFSSLRYFLVGQLLCTAIGKPFENKCRQLQALPVTTLGSWFAFAGWCVMILGVHTESHIIMIAGFVLHGFGIHTAVASLAGVRARFDTFIFQDRTHSNHRLVSCFVLSFGFSAFDLACV